MPDTPTLIAAWARSAVAPHGGAFRHLHAHEIGAPVLQALLQRTRLPASAVDAVVMGNALGAGGNPARMVALAAGLPDREGPDQGCEGGGVADGQVASRGNLQLPPHGSAAPGAGPQG